MIAYVIWLWTSVQTSICFSTVCAFVRSSQIVYGIISWGSGWRGRSTAHDFLCAVSDGQHARSFFHTSSSLVGLIEALFARSIASYIACRIAGVKKNPQGADRRACRCSVVSDPINAGTGKRGEAG